MITRGTYCNPFEKRGAKKRLAACLLRRLCDPHVQDIAVLVHGSPQVMSLATDREEDLVQMPLVATTRSTTAQFIGVRLPKLQTPLPHRFIAHDDPALCQKLFNITKTERETEIQPHGMADDLRRETKTFVIGRNAVCFHTAILTYCSALLPGLQYRWQPAEWFCVLVPS